MKWAGFVILELYTKLGKLDRGSHVEVTIVRKGAPVTLTYTLIYTLI